MKITPNIPIKTQFKLLRGKKYLALAALLLASAASATAQTLVNPAYWVGGAADFNNQSFWQTTSSAAAGSANAVYIGSANPNCANDNGSNNVVLIQPGDPIWQHGDTLAGNENNTTGAYLQTGSTNNTGGGNWFRMAVATGSYGSYILSNGVVNVGGQTHIGEYGVGSLEIDGGTFNTAADPFCIGDGDFGPSPIGYMVMNGGTNNITSEFWIGEGNANNRGTGYFTMNGGTINVNFWWDIGRWGADGYFTMNDGVINKTGGGDCQWGAYNNAVPSSATVNMTGGTININNNLEIGSGGNGAVGGTCLFNQSGGTIHVGGEYRIANYSISSVATNNVSGNAVVIVDNWLAVGRAGGVGTMNISGNASVTKTGVGGNITLSGDNGGTSFGVVNQTGGTVTNTATQTWVAENYYGYWNLSGGSDVLGVIHLTQNAGANGTFNLNGGDLTATEITDVGGTGTLNLNGGTLHAGSDVNPLIHDLNGGVNLMSGGVTIDSAGYDVNITQAIADGGGGNLTKTGNGTLTLSGVNTYTGSTIVNQGTLASTTASFAEGNYSVADSAGLNIIVAGVGTALYPANVTLGTTTGASVGFDLGAYGNTIAAPLSVSGNLTLNGTITVNLADATPALGEFPLIQYGTKSGSGTFLLGSLPPGVQAVLVPTANGLDINITGVALDVWNGLAGGNWDINVTTNWSNAGTGMPVTYQDGDQVRFDDTVTGTPVVNLVANVVPGASVLFNNSITNYTLMGNGSINGLIGLTKSGSNSVMILNTNGYTGVTTLNGGTVVVSNLTSGGVAGPIGAATSSTNNLLFNGGTLSYAGPATTFSRGFTLQGNYGLNAATGTNIGTFDVQNGLTLNGPMVAAPNSSFVKSGPGTLTYTGTGTNQLSGGNDPGYQIIAGTVVFNGSAGLQVNHNQQELWIGDTTNSGANIILTNTTLNIDNWFVVGRGNGSSGFTSTADIFNSTLKSVNFSMGFDDGRTNFATQNFAMTNSTFVDGGSFFVGESAGSTSTANISGQSTVNQSGGDFNIGINGMGTVNISDQSAITSSGNFEAGLNSGSFGTINISDQSTVSQSGGDFNSGVNGNGTINISGQSIVTSSGNFSAGLNSGSLGTINISGQSIVTDVGPMRMGLNTGATGIVVVAGSSIVTNNNWLSCGANGNGTLILKDNARYYEGSDFNFGDYGAAGTVGNLTIQDNAQVVMIGGGSVYVGKTASSFGYVTQSSGIVHAEKAGVFQLAQLPNSYGQWIQTGGTNYAGGWLSIGRGSVNNDSGIGLYVISAGLLEQTGTGNGLIVGEQATGTLTITNSATVLSDADSSGIGVAIGWNTGTGILNLDGGTLVANYIQGGSGNSTFNFDGGVLRVGLASRLNFMTNLTSVYLYRDSVIDTANKTIAISSIINDGGMGGGLTKNGAGILLMDGVSYYSGNTTVTAGTLGGIGTISGPVIVNSGATLAPGDNSIGTLALNNTLTLAGGSTTVMELNKTTGMNDMVTASAINYNGTLVLKNLSGTLQVGDSFTLFSGGNSGSFNIVSQTPNQTVTWDTSQLAASGIVTVATAVAAPVSLTPVVSNGNINLSWPADQTGWELQWQSNPLSIGLSNNWTVVAGSTSTNQVSIPVGTGAAFFRLVFPQQ